jgi:hypothetical protein
MALASFASSAAFAQNAPPTFQADPNVYKVIFEDQNFRVIAATWVAGATDKPHSHPVPSIAYELTDCTLEITSADGKTIASILRLELRETYRLQCPIQPTIRALLNAG